MTTSTRKPSKPFHPKVIKTPAEHERALGRIEELFSAKPGTPAGDELELLLLLVETYEANEYPIDLPDPIEAIRFRMGQAKLKQKDLIPIIGSKSKVSEVLNGRRELSLTMIRKLVNEFGIPAEVLLQERGEAPNDADYSE
jgi:HTH-type transcriptional regulator/antitoxin HigA